MPRLYEVTIGSGEGAAAPVGSVADMVGFAPGSALYITRNNEGEAAANADIAYMGATGCKWFRIDAHWPSSEPTNGSFDWQHIDWAVSTAQAAGMTNVILTPFQCPSWANGVNDDVVPPTNPAYYEDYCYNLAYHFIDARNVVTYEIWNEPNLIYAFHRAGGVEEVDVALYTSRLLIPGYNGIKRAAADRGVPVTVLIGGLSSVGTTGIYGMNWLEFLQGIYTNGGGNYFDACAYHPYCQPYAPDNPWWRSFIDGVPELRNEMFNVMGQDKKVWCTEVGWPTRSSGTRWIDGTNETYYEGGWVDEGQTFTSRVQQTIDTWFQPSWVSWVGPLMWYHHRDRQADPTFTDPELHFGLRRNDDTTKPAYAAFVDQMARALPLT